MASDLINRETFQKRSVVSQYSREEGLQAAEAKALALLRAELTGKAILDLGVGTGRTTPILREISTDYRGVDYAPRMIEECRKRFPAVDISVGDARNLSRLADRSIDLVVFSFNGIDYVHHEDRLRIIKEVLRVLAPCGAFCFSSTNRNRDPIDPAWHPRTLRLREYPTLNPIRIGHRLMRYALRTRNALRYRRLEEISDEYAILNTPSHDYGLLQYHITPDKQAKQLRDAGFGLVAVVTRDGAVPELLWPTLRESVYYIARKPA